MHDGIKCPPLFFKVKFSSGHMVNERTELELETNFSIIDYCFFSLYSMFLPCPMIQYSLLLTYTASKVSSLGYNQCSYLLQVS